MGILFLDGVGSKQKRQPIGRVFSYNPRSHPRFKQVYRKALLRQGMLYTIVSLSLYILGAPYIPLFSLRLPRAKGESLPISAPQKEAGVKAAVSLSLAEIVAEPVREYRLHIPQMGVDAPLEEGDTEQTLEKGVWHRPGTGIPGEIGNVVLAAHRFKYISGPKTFYYLDKLKIGDIFEITWQSGSYKYQVNEVKIVTSKAVDIEKPSEKALVTLYTCTPLWSSEKRLVVVANLI